MDKGGIKVRILSGMRATGKLHLGHVLVLEDWKKLQDDGNETFFFVADWHALTTHKEESHKIYQSTLDIVRGYLASGIDPEKSVIFVQSAIKEHAELYLLFNMLVSVSRLERIPTYKELKENLKTKDLSTAGFLTYPVLQTADILIYKATGVPVGEDQVYHIELSREIARKFNNLYKEVFPEPDPIITRIPKLPGTDGRKMSKSYGNIIMIDETSESLKKKIMPMMTDPARMRRTDPGDPAKCPVWNYHKAFTHSQEELDWVVKGCKNAEIGCVQCKKVLLKNMEERLKDIWEKYEKISDEDVLNVIHEGNKKASKVARKTLEEVRGAMNLRW